MLWLKHISKSYGDKLVLDDIDYEFDAGRVYAVLGAAGAGKTTLAKCICADILMDDGEVKNRGRQRVFFAAEDPEFPKCISGADYIRLLIAVKNSSKDYAAYMKKAGIAKRLWHKNIEDYRPEEKRRLQLAAYLVQKPHAIVFDGLLDECSIDFFDTFSKLADDECDRKIIIVTTSKLSVAKELGADILLLNNGGLSPVTSEMLDVPEIKQALTDILGDMDDDNY